MTAKTKSKESFLTYKGRPLVRSGNTIYYGNMWEKYVAVLQIINTKTVLNEEVSGTIVIHLVSTDATVPMNKRVIKQSEKVGLYNALDVACIWLTRELDS
jgi:hypothetical protein